VRELYHYTEGNPFFLVNIVDDLVAHGVIIHTDGQWFLQENWEKGQLQTPGGVQQLIEVQTDRLSQEEQRVLEVASVVGVEFSAAAVAAGLGMEVLSLEEQCEGLARRAQFLHSQGSSEWPDGTVSARYRFLHSLYQQACYNRVTAGKRVQLHRQIGERIAAAYGERAKEIAAELAVHFERGHDSQRAVYYCRKAAENALRRYGYREAIDHLTKGLQLLQKLPDSPERVRQEIGVQIPLGVALVATKGHAASEVEHVYTRALALCQQAEVMPQLGWTLWGLQTCYFVRGKLQTAREFADQLLSVAQRHHHKELLGVAHYLLGSTLFSLGELNDARAHLEQGIAVCTSEKHQRLQVACYSFGARTLWALGYPEQALAMNQEALTLAHELAHPFTLVVALGITALLHVARREAPIVQAQAEAAMKLAADHGFTDWMAQATLLRGWALAQQGHEAMGIEQMRQGLAAYQATGATVGQSLFLGLLADVYGKAGRITEGLQAVTEARSVAQQNGQRVWEAWLEWLTGELTLRKFQVSSFKFKKVRSPRSEVRSRKQKNAF
jgi:predicted ATPase